MPNIIFDFKRGGAGVAEILYGTVTMKPTLAHARGTSFVLPAPTTWDLIDGKATATNIQASPVPNTENEIEWGYVVTAKDNFGKSFEWLVGVPDVAGDVNFTALPRYYETKPPLFGEGPEGPVGESATVDVGTVTGGTTASITNSGTPENAVLDFVLPQGPQGPPGLGVDLAPSFRPAEDLPATYDNGVTIHRIGGVAEQGTWPLTFATVVTHKNGDGRVSQSIVNSALRTFTRVQTGTLWTAWREGANTDLATVVANGLMSSTDKTHLEGLFGGYNTKSSTDAITTYPFGTQTMLVGSTLGWPHEGFNIVTTYRQGRTGGTLFSAASYQIALPYLGSASGYSILIRKPIAGDLWGDWEALATQRYVDSRGLNTPYLYGAVGDGVANDTGAVIAWLDSANPVKHLDRGTFLVDGVTTAQSGISVIGLGGKLKGNITNSIVLSFTGNNVKVEGVEVDGGGVARGGVYFSGDRPTLKDCHIHHAYTTNSLAYGVCLQNLTQGYSVVGNEIHDIHSVGNATQGDSDGASRAIYVTTANSVATGETVRRGLISQNVISDIAGEEGDAIQVIIMPNYGSAKVDVTGNTLNGFSRRGIKLQAGDCVVQGNNLYSDAITNNYANVITGIDSQYAAHNKILNNTVTLIGFTSAISAIGSADTNNRQPGIVIKGNVVRGGAVNSRNTSASIVEGNTVTFSNLYGIYIQGAEQASVIGNSIISESLSTDRAAIYVGFNCDRSNIQNNTLVGGVVEWLVTVNSPRCTVKDNLSLALDSAQINGNGSSSSGSIYDNNNFQSAALSFVGYNASQIHKGFTNGRAGSYIPNIYFSTTDPSTNGRHHTKGDVYINFSATSTSGGKAGWICTTGGNPGTFRTFGAID